MVVGSAWYSPLLFVNAWMKELGISKPQMTPALKQQMMQSMAGQLVASFVMAYVLAYALGYAGARTAGLGVQVALWLWLGFQATGAASHVFFEKKSWTWFAINAGCSFITAIVMGAIIGGWRW